MEAKGFIKEHIPEPVFIRISNRKNRLLSLRSNHYIKKACKKRSDPGRIIKVGFIVQMPELWDKQESVFLEMRERPEFEPYIIIIPAYDFTSDCIGEYGQELDFFIGKCKGQNCIKALNNDEWADVAAMGFDYIFYQRPYDHYLPEIYQSDSLVKYTKICYIPYATSDAKDIPISPDRFFRNIYLGFSEDEETAELNNLRHRHTGHKSFINAGYPVFERCMSISSECSYSNVLWTPRWGFPGSHFTDYNKTLTEYDWIDNTLTIRPHPLMWNNFEKLGLITSSEAEIIKERWAERNIIMDENKSVERTFETTDILISDVSSLVPMFFLTGKPVIYCPFETEYVSLYESVLPGVYKVWNEGELLSTLDMLLRGEDPLRDKRMEIIRNKFEQHRSATETIVSAIKEDYLSLQKG